MSASEEKWERLMDYFVELDRVCDSVHSELDENRRKRHDWHHSNQSWKQTWLSDHAGSSGPSRNGDSLRGQSE